MKSCELCEMKTENIVWQDKLCRLIIAKDKNLYGVHRIIWNDHVSELSFLSKINRHHLFTQLIEAEKYILKKFQPHKINIASFGNMVPHLHWHIIPRWKTDPWWPNTIWNDIQMPQWSTLANSLDPSSSDLICIGDWNNLKSYVQSIRNSEFAVEKKSCTNNYEDELDFISRHIVIKVKNKPIATGKLHPSGKIDKIIVLENYKHREYERLILKKIITEAKIKKLTKVFIHRKASEGDYYKQEGFVNQSTESNETNQNYHTFIKNIYN